MGGAELVAQPEGNLARFLFTDPIARPPDDRRLRELIAERLVVLHPGRSAVARDQVRILTSLAASRTPVARTAP
ncbi:hypothetical protein [Naumannella cuiyingiana]|uniref:Uncharacterized protein n=1 Tax=Naumannella cuiyingiana TaxID=1347891 RepID=A0A7Z0ILE5_9ACTN|nr:hypothetical protein [Naumannella cuiyingiana]NYI71508.1 hypothetical protein [Naumannella cuiyingiana]